MTWVHLPGGCGWTKGPLRAQIAADASVNCNLDMLMKPVDQYQENGYVILRRFFSNTEIAAIGGFVDRIYKKWMSARSAEIYSQMM